MTDSFQTVTDKTNSLNSTAAACLDSLSGICLNGIIGLSSGPTPVLKSGLGSVHLAHVPLLPPIPISVPREPSLLASAPSRDPLARDACLLCHSLAPRRRFPSLFRWHVSLANVGGIDGGGAGAGRARRRSAPSATDPTQRGPQTARPAQTASPGRSTCPAPSAAQVQPHSCIRLRQRDLPHMMHFFFAHKNSLFAHSRFSRVFFSMKMAESEKIISLSCIINFDEFY